MKIEYTKRIIAFIDILGFAKIIKDSADEKKKRGAVKKLSFIYDIFQTVNLSNSEITQFSDSIVISIPHDEKDGAFHFILALQHLIFELAAEKILCRGGISIGELYHKGNTILGPALVEAYMMESKIANYPRVIVGPNIIRIAKTYKGEQNSNGDIDSVFKRILGYDSDGYYYVDYLDIAEEFDVPHEYPIYLDTICTIAKEGINNSDVTIRAKFIWLALKYNAWIIQIDNNGYSLVKTEHLFIPGITDREK